MLDPLGSIKTKKNGLSFQTSYLSGGSVLFLSESQGLAPSRHLVNMSINGKLTCLGWRNCFRLVTHCPLFQMCQLSKPALENYSQPPNRQLPSAQNKKACRKLKCSLSSGCFKRNQGFKIRSPLSPSDHLLKGTTGLRASSDHIHLCMLPAPGFYTLKAKKIQ